MASATQAGMIQRRYFFGTMGLISDWGIGDDF